MPGPGYHGAARLSHAPVRAHKTNPLVHGMRVWA
jgi:hypothetical protein